MGPVKLQHLIPVLVPYHSLHSPISPKQRAVLGYVDGYTCVAALPTLMGCSLDEVTDVIQELISLRVIQLYQRPTPGPGVGLHVSSESIPARDAEHQTPLSKRNGTATYRQSEAYLSQPYLTYSQSEWGYGENDTMRWPPQPSQARPGSEPRHTFSPRGGLREHIARDHQATHPGPVHPDSRNHLTQVLHHNTLVNNSQLGPSQAQMNPDKTLVTKYNHPLQMGPPRSELAHQQQVPSNHSNPRHPGDGATRRFNSHEGTRRSVGDEDTMREQNPPALSRIQQRYRERLSKTYTNMRQGTDTGLPEK